MGQPLFTGEQSSKERVKLATFYEKVFNFQRVSILALIDCRLK
jgi:hypothetical protein